MYAVIRDQDPTTTIIILLEHTFIFFSLPKYHMQNVLVRNIIIKASGSCPQVMAEV
jgi:hypothetical protein